MKWYLVKTNWPRTEDQFPGFAGLGGDVWPLDSARSTEASAAQSSVETARSPVPLKNSTEMLCGDPVVATRYARLCASLLEEGRFPLLLEVGLASDGDEVWEGFDVGPGSGGYSLIESEILHGRREWALNRIGLFESVSDVASYLSLRREEGLEDLGSLEVVGIRVLEVVPH